MKNSAIEWTHHTFNPWIGCTKVSPGCKNCYAEALDKRWRPGNARWGVGTDRERTSIANWKKPLEWNREALALAQRPRVFCASLADVFDHEVAVSWRVDLFTLIRQTPHLAWLLLTKRPENAASMIRGVHFSGHAPGDTEGLKTQAWAARWADGTPPENVWLGTTVEDQERANERIPKLLKVPAAVRFLSCEPLLERVDLEPLTCQDCGGHEVHTEPIDATTCTQPWCTKCDVEMGDPDWLGLDGIDWVIAGGESGHHSRPMVADWARALRDQCAANEVPFLFKQWGEHDATGAKVGKKTAGRLLDGVQHDGYPAGGA